VASTRDRGVGSRNRADRVGENRLDGEIRNHASFIWSVADLLRGTYKQSDYGKVILPLVVIRRLDCVLDPTKDDVLARAKSLKGKVENVDPVLRSVAGQQFYTPRRWTSGACSTTRTTSPTTCGPTSAGSPTPRGTSSRSSTSTHRSRGSTGRTSSTRSSRAPPTSTSTPRLSPISRWATSTRS